MAWVILVGPVGSVKLLGVACLAPCAEEEEGPGTGYMTSGASIGGLEFLLCAVGLHLTGVYSGQRRGWA